MGLRQFKVQSRKRSSVQCARPRRFADGRSRLSGSRCDDVFPADEFGECDDTIGYEFRVLDDVVEWLTTAGLAVWTKWV
jgi:hypothetical protein